MAQTKANNIQENELYNELKKLAKKANQRIVRLERAFGKDRWATKKLRDMLDIEPLQAWTKTGRIKVNKNMTPEQLQATITATRKFLNSKVSTVSGVKKVRHSTITKIAENLEIDEKQLSYDEAETLYDLTTIDYMQDILSKIPASKLWVIIAESIERKDTEKQWLERISDYIDFGNDMDMKNKLIMLYNDYIKGK